MTKADILYILIGLLTLRGTFVLLYKVRKHQDEGIKDTLLFTTAACLVLLVSAIILNFMNK